MAIRRKPDEPPGDLPAAKLYLDDIAALVEILSAAIGDQPSSDSPNCTVTFRVGDQVCDTLADLQSIGGRKTEFDIWVRNAKSWRASSLRIHRYGTALSLASGGDLEWAQSAKVVEIFKTRSIWWRNAIHGVPGLVWAVLWVAFMVLISSPIRAVYLAWVGATGIFAVLLVLLTLLEHSVVWLHYRYEGGLGKWLERNAATIITGILAALLGAFVKGLLDRWWR